MQSKPRGGWEKNVVEQETRRPAAVGARGSKVPRVRTPSPIQSRQEGGRKRDGERCETYSQEKREKETPG